MLLQKVIQSKSNVADLEYLSSKPYDSLVLAVILRSRYCNTLNISSVRLSWDSISQYHDNIILIAQHIHI